MGRLQPRYKAGVNFMGVESVSQTNPKKGRAVKLKENIQEIRVTHQPVITNAQLHGPSKIYNISTLEPTSDK